MRDVVPGSVAALALTGFLLCVFSVLPAVAGDHPEVEKALSLYAKALTERDLEALDRLLGPEYTAGNGQSEWDRELELKMQGSMFENSEAVELTFADGYEVTETAEGTWEVTGLLPTLRVLFEGKWFTAEATPELPVTMTVVQKEGEEVQIARWFSPSE